MDSWPNWRISFGITVPACDFYVMVNGGGGRVARVSLINLLFGNQRAAQLSRSRFVNSYRVVLRLFLIWIMERIVLAIIDDQITEITKAWNLKVRGMRKNLLLNKDCIFYEESFCKNASLLCRSKISVKN